MDNARLVDYLACFTETFRAYSDKNIYEREARCNEVQYRGILLEMRPGDLIVGRIAEAPIGFLPQSSAGVGYYCDVRRMQALAEDAALDAPRREKAIALTVYWQGKTTKERIQARYTPEQHTLLSHGDFQTDPGVGFPLYRMSGAQMTPRRLLELGIDGMAQRVAEHRAKTPALTQALLDTLALLREVILRYRDEALALAEACPDAARGGELRAMADNLEHIASRPATSLWQAMQLSYLFYLLSGTFNYGRMDDYLGGYYAADVDAERIDEAFALALVKNLWSLMIERKTYWDGRVVLGGENRVDPQAADRFAMVALEASHQLRDVLPQLTLRMCEGMDPALLDKAMTMLGDGCTFPILYNDAVNIPAVAEAFDVDARVAADYVPFGCGEYVLYGKSFGTPSGTINLLYGLTTMIQEGEVNVLATCPDFESFYRAYVRRMGHYIALLAQQEKLEYDVCGEEAAYLFFSLMFGDCVERGLGVFEGGIRYLGGTLETYGNINASDSLAAIKRVVYEKKAASPIELEAALRANFEGYEALRAELLAVPKYGNDDEAADGMAVRLNDEINELIRDSAKPVGLHSYLGVMINNSMNTNFGMTSGASPDGRLAHTYLANANNPVGGMDKNGITAMLNSLVKLRPNRHAGSVQNMRFSREMFTRMRPKTEGLLRAYFANGGTQAMITVLNRGDLENALREPERHRNLIVRVGGFSARFVELAPAVQQELLSRMLY